MQNAGQSPAAPTPAPPSESPGGSIVPCTSGSCSNSSFCNLDNVDTGFCEPCPFFSSCESLGLITQEGLADCTSSCPALGLQEACTGGSCPFALFCGMQNGTEGLCEACPYLNGGESCAAASDYLTAEGMADCETSCTGPVICTAGSCPETGFCNLDFNMQEDGEALCVPCPPSDLCAQVGLVSSESVADCASSCTATNGTQHMCLCYAHPADDPSAPRVRAHRSVSSTLVKRRMSPPRAE